MKKLLYNLSIFADIINGAFSHNKQLHNARFAKLNDLKALTVGNFDEDEAILIGKDSFNNVLAVRA